jgi:prepilin-type N-terminal cleavage/methylation domain-containing protein
MQRMAHHRCKGFTIIELIVVITIVLLLASLIITVVQRARASALDASCVSNLKAIGTSVLGDAVRNGGSLPTLAGSGLPLYAVGGSLEAFWTEHQLPAKMAYCPAFSGGTPAASGQWAYTTPVHSITGKQVPISLIVDNVDDSEDKRFNTVAGSSWGVTSYKIEPEVVPYGDSSVQTREAGDVSAQWTFALPEGKGSLTVEAWYMSNNPNGRSNQVYYTVETGSGPQTVGPFSQKPYGSGWITLGSFSFTGGGTRSVKVHVSDNPYGTYIVADAIRLTGSLESGGGKYWRLTSHQEVSEFTSPVDIVVDNADSLSDRAFRILNGDSWNRASEYSLPPDVVPYGLSHATTKEAGDVSAEWSFALPPGEGPLAIKAWYLSNSPDARSDQVYYTINTGDGQSETVGPISQKPYGSGWLDLGSFAFTGGATRSIALYVHNNVSGRYIVADAVQISGVLENVSKSPAVMGYLCLRHRLDLPGIIHNGSLNMPYSLSVSKSPSTTPLFVDIHFWGLPKRSAHDGEHVHALMLDGGVRTIPASNVIMRWTDSNGVVYGW